MSELINKISSYNLFNYLLPGAIFVVFVEYFTSYKILQKNMLINAFLVYFIGLVISRIGSLIIEWLLKLIVLHEDYNKFIEASKNDKKIEILSEVNNMYRTFVSLFSVLLVFKVCLDICTLTKGQVFYILALLLLIIFIFSYIKQTNYIKIRIKHHFKKDEK